MHQPYEKTRGRKPDFIVEYHISPCEELKEAIPTQGMRLDLKFEDADRFGDGAYMIWPEVLDERGNVVLDDAPGNVPNQGQANMWVLLDETREALGGIIKAGDKCWWVRGSYKYAQATVIELVGLPINKANQAGTR